jgi:hypothetical protein
MSTNLKEFVESALSQNKLKVPVHLVYHPTENTEATFDFVEFQKKPQIVQIGSWLRNPYAIYTVKSPFTKLLLSPGDSYILTELNLKNGYHVPKRCNHFHYALRHLHGFVGPCECHLYTVNGNLNIPDAHLKESEHFAATATTILNSKKKHHRMCRPHHHHNNTATNFMLTSLFASGKVSDTIIACEDCTETYPPGLPTINKTLTTERESVAIIQKLSDPEYDTLLSKTVVFLNLVDAVAVNTVIECIIRRTPVILNRLPATEEYLGKGYPLFYK